MKHFETIVLDSPCLKHKLLLLPLRCKENPTYCSAVWAVSYERPILIPCGYLWLFIFKHDSSDSSLDTETHWSPTSCSCSEHTDNRKYNSPSWAYNYTFNMLRFCWLTISWTYSTWKATQNMFPVFTAQNIHVYINAHFIAFFSDPQIHKP